ncbi:MAG TPA: hypothetical protein VE074_02415 [Jatrophihabitantaceae bacterium]|nr:hypothetical protein [Jatrophihabitantaceae bacterium]
MPRWPITWTPGHWRRTVWRWPTATPPIVAPSAPPEFIDRRNDRPAPEDTSAPDRAGE